MFALSLTPLIISLLSAASFITRSLCSALKWFCRWWLKYFSDPKKHRESVVGFNSCLQGYLRRCVSGHKHTPSAAVLCKMSLQDDVCQLNMKPDTPDEVMLWIPPPSSTVDSCWGVSFYRDWSRHDLDLVPSVQYNLTPPFRHRQIKNKKTWQFLWRTSIVWWWRRWFNSVVRPQQTDSAVKEMTTATCFF